MAFPGALFGPQVKYGSSEAQRQQAIAQQLLRAGVNTSPVQGGIGEALARVGTAGIGGYLSNQAGETEKAYNTDRAQTLARALSAGQGLENAPGPNIDGTAGVNVPPDPNRMAQILMGNPSTADLGSQLAIGNMTFARDRAAKKEDVADERGFRKEMFGMERQAKLEDTDLSQRFQREMAQINQAFQSGQLSQQQAFQAAQAAQLRAFTADQGMLGREHAINLSTLNAANAADNKTPIVAPDPSSATGYTYRLPSDVIGQPATAPVPKISSTAEKELFEADDIMRNSAAALKLLGDAEKLNPQARSGATAGVMTFLDRNAPDFLPGLDKAQAARTTDFNSIITGQALESLRSTFGGNPTEGERKILLDIQAAPNMSVEERAALIERTKTAVASRLAAAEAKAASIRGQTFAKPQQPGFPSAPAATTPEIPALPPGFTVLP